MDLWTFFDVTIILQDELLGFLEFLHWSVLNTCFFSINPIYNIQKKYMNFLDFSNKDEKSEKSEKVMKNTIMYF